MTPYADYPAVMSRYNRWMNESLYGLCAALPDADRKRDRGVSYRSLYGTLNHLLRADRLWLSRFDGIPGVEIPAEETEG